LYKLPIAISGIFGKKLHKTGQVEECEKDTTVALKRWYDETRKFLPEGTILMQSSTAHSLPYPAYLYGKGTWAAIDILYFMPDIPITYGGEIDGEVFKVGQSQTIFQHKQVDTSSGNQNELKRSNSQVMMALNSSQNADTTANTNSTQAEERRGIPRVSSGANIAAVYVE